MQFAVRDAAETVLDKVVDGTKLRRTVRRKQEIAEPWRFEVEIDYKHVPVAAGKVRGGNRKRRRPTHAAL